MSIMNKLLYFTYFFIFTFGYCIAQTAQQKGLATINRNAAEAHIYFLASDALEGREAGFAGSRIAAEYIAANLRSLGIQPFFDQYFQDFEAYNKGGQKREKYQIHPDSIKEIMKFPYRKFNMKNVLGKIEGKKPNEYVIVGAHFDHLGIDPLLTGDQIYNGADDNASGVSAALQIAKAFVATGVQPERTVIFAFWDGEEEGLLGSSYFVQTFPDLSEIKSYLNFDMIGRNTDENKPEHVVFFYTEAYPIFESWLREDIDTYQFKLKPDYRAWDRPIGGGDNTSFAKHDIPLIWYHTDGHPDYHQPSDHADKINWEKLVDITKAAFLNMWNMANDDIKAQK